ncbi:hypothetical protein HHI36_021388 [Cryptolaemus montrouzieri]|uniref:Transmembrane protein 53 n=1 Tax=Cryptolaemus montrouzieri TaxID=559131 RepID=A0ABD2MWM8_9CUCU
MFEKMAEPDNLEYYITFPNPNFNYKNQNGDSDFVFVINEDKIPVVILFGWAGAEDKYLSVYSRIYEKKGLITLRYISPVKYLFWRQNRMVKIGEKLVKLLNDLNFENHPIIIHCFSNGGAFQYQFFSQALRLSPKPMQIKGVIFDSAPGKRRILSLFRAIRAIKGGNKLLNLPACLLMTMFFTTMWLFEIIQKNKWPQHFIYSKADILIPYQDVEYFASYRKSQGIDVTLKCYEDTPHVRHYPDNKRHKQFLGSPNLKEAYSDAQFTLKKAIVARKKQYFHDKIRRAADDFKKLWKSLNEISGSSKKESKQIKSPTIDNVEISDVKQIAQELNHFFTSIGHQVDHSPPPEVYVPPIQGETYSAGDQPPQMKSEL